MSKKRTQHDLLKRSYWRTIPTEIKDLWGKNATIYVNEETAKKLKKWRRHGLTICPVHD